MTKKEFTELCEKRENEFDDLLFSIYEDKYSLIDEEEDEDNRDDYFRCREKDESYEDFFLRWFGDRIYEIHLEDGILFTWINLWESNSKEMFDSFMNSNSINYNQIHICN